MVTAVIVAAVLSAVPAVAQQTIDPPNGELPYSSVITESDGAELEGDACDALPRPLRPWCRVAAGGDGSLIGGVVMSGVDAALSAIVEWVVVAAAWLLSELVGMIDSSTRPDVRADWFASAYRDMAVIGSIFALFLLLLSVFQALLRQSVGHLVRAAFVYVPIAAVGTFGAAVVVDSLVVVTDGLLMWIGRAFRVNLATFAVKMGEALTGTITASGGLAAVGMPGFAALLAGLVIAFASLVIWVLLVLREAAIYFTLLFLPLGFAALVWPAAAHWLRRLVELLVALIMAKFIIVAGMSLGAAMLAVVGDEGFPAVVAGGSMLLLTMFAPFTTLRLTSVFESGQASQLDGVTTQRTSPVPGPTAGGVYRGVQRARAGSAARASLGSGGGAAAGVAGAGAGLAVAGASRAGAALRSTTGQTLQVAGGAGQGQKPAPGPAGGAGGPGSPPAGASGAGGTGPGARPAQTPPAPGQAPPSAPQRGPAPGGGGARGARPPTGGGPSTRPPQPPPPRTPPPREG